MSEGDIDRRSGEDRRSANGVIAETARNADVGISMLWRWASIITTIVCFGFTMGVFYAKTSTIETAIKDMKGDIRTLSDSKAATVTDNALIKQSLAQREKEVAELKQEVRELRQIVNQMRDMREAYVYSAAGSKMKLTTPP